MKLFLFIIAINYSLNIFSQDWGLYQSLRGTENWERRRQSKINDMLMLTEMENQARARRQEAMAKENKTSCKEAIIYVLDAGVLKAEVDEYTLNSSWLKKTKIYEIEDKYVVLAWIKPKDYYSDVYVYIFCEIPASNWNYFVDQFSTLSYGERFNKYIFENKCNCQ